MLYRLSPLAPGTVLFLCRANLRPAPHESITLLKKDDADRRDPPTVVAAGLVKSEACRHHELGVFVEAAGSAFHLLPTAATHC
jgi:hypothetical protein